MFVQRILVDAHDHILAAIDARLLHGRAFLDHALGRAGGDILGHPSCRIGLGNQFPGLLGQCSRQRLDIITAAQRVCDARNPAFLLQHQLRVARDPGGEIGRQGQRLVERIGVQALRAAQRGRHRFHSGADDVVIRVLFLQRDSRCLAVGAQHLRFVRPGAETLHDIVPQPARRAQLGDFHEEVHPDAEEERQARRESIDVEPRFHRAADIFLAVGNGEGELLHRRRPGLVHVIAADGDRIEARHFRRAIGDDVADDPHARLGRINVGVADHELLENVVLDGSGELLPAHALPLRRDDIERHHRDHRPVHRHRNAHFVERDAVEQYFHVAHRVDRDAGHADIAHHARMVGIVATMRGKVEGDRKALLPCRKIAAVEDIAFLRRREARILSDRPRPHGIHAGIWPASERREAGQAGAVCRRILRRVERLHRDPFRRMPGEVAPLRFRFGFRLPVGLVAHPAPVSLVTILRLAGGNCP